MERLRYLMMALSAVGGVMLLSEGILGFGGNGVLTFLFCLAPLGLGTVVTVSKTGLTRGQAVLSAAFFLITVKNTNEAFQNTMILVFFGMLICIVLAIKPEAK
ncbi:MAG: hypothetical protein ACI9OJ_003365 [Myxococcota bacterium]|jgi:hypothetical protein